MAELLFIATTIFVAYVVFVVIGGKKEKPEGVKPEAVKPEATKPAAPAEQTAPAAAVKTAEKPSPAKPSSTKPAASKTSKASSAKTAAAKTSTVAADSLKNPKTGEIAKIPASYAFAKRWIKDALVDEGLLDKVYKNNELDDATNAKIQAALQQLKTLDKYQ